MPICKKWQLAFLFGVVVGIFVSNLWQIEILKNVFYQGPDVKPASFDTKFDNFKKEIDRKFHKHFKFAKMEIRQNVIERVNTIL